MGRPHVSSTLEVTAERDVRIEEGDIVLGRGGEKLVADVRDVYFPRRHATGVKIGGDFCWWPLLAVGSESPSGRVAIVLPGWRVPTIVFSFSLINGPWICLYAYS